jgi:hypothetical protein
MKQSIVKEAIKQLLFEILDTINNDISNFNIKVFNNKNSEAKFKIGELDYEIFIKISFKRYDMYNTTDKEFLDKVFTMEPGLPQMYFTSQNSFDSTNQGNPGEVCKYVGGFVRLYVDKFNSKIISYYPTEKKRENLYDYLFKKHFTDYTVYKNGQANFLIRNDIYEDLKN